MPQRQTFRELPALSREVDAAFALHADMPVACHALQRGSHCRRSYIQLFRQTRADGRLPLLEHLVDGFEVIFLRNAGFISPQNILLAQARSRREVADGAFFLSSGIPDCLRSL